MTVVQVRPIPAFLQRAADVLCNDCDRFRSGLDLAHNDSIVWMQCSPFLCYGIGFSIAYAIQL